MSSIKSFEQETTDYILHQRLLAGDLTASAEIAEAYLFEIVENLRRKYPNLDDPHLIDTAVEDAFINYFNRPEQYNPQKSNLKKYLEMSAHGDLLNLLKREQRHRGDLRLSESVALDGSTPEHGVEVADDFDLEDWVVNKNSPLWQELQNLFPDQRDQEMLLLMMDGVRETGAYVEVLGLSEEQAEEHALIIKRHKDRIKKKIQRYMERRRKKDD